MLRYGEDFYCVLCTKRRGAFKMLAPSHHRTIAPSVVFLKKVTIIKFRDIIRETAPEAWRLSCCNTPWEDGSQELNRRNHKTYRGRRRCATITSAFAWSVREDRRKLQSWSLTPSRFRAGSFRRRVYILTATPICCMQCRNQCSKRSRRGQPAVIYINNKGEIRRDVITCL